MIRYGKESGPLLRHKQSFFDNNAELLAENHRVGAIYRQQPRRTACKCCADSLEGVSFEKLDIEYVVCARCGHVSGVYEDTDAFCAAVYTEGQGAEYARAYSSADREAYDTRVQDIYLPKAEFLKEALRECGEEPSAMSLADFGAGSGYLVSALRTAGWSQAQGYEVGAAQVALADAMLGQGSVRAHGLAETALLCGQVEAEVVSMIGVLEHLQRPREVLASLRRNPRVRYLFLALPLFSPCVALEAVFPKVFQRQLAMGHTHLYTDRSIDWFCKEFELQRVAEWWFGTDMVDLLRAVGVELERTEATRGLAPLWREQFAPAIDEAQLALDRRKLASEVHLVLRFTDDPA